MDAIAHPCKFSDSVLDVMRPYLKGVYPILDPFAGVGKIRQVNLNVFTNEIEPEWARAGRASTIGNALALPYAADTFAAIVTSPTYANRMADHHNARDGSKRITYTHVLGRQLHPDNSGALAWGAKYRGFHMLAWMECRRVLRPGGLFLLNISDHIRAGVVIPVSAWHVAFLEQIGFRVEGDHKVMTRRMKRGQNAELRVDYEHVYVLRKGA